ncbi:MAG TPA: glycosyltransferase family 4 protein [Phycisphaerae bacterium]|nr:glycosyltransferase family 4 protein [Phycisphaerae bacterium]
MADRLRVQVEGWRRLAHSYALVNQYQCLAMMDRPNIDLRHVDRPLFKPWWRRVDGLLKRDAEKRLEQLRAPEPGWHPDVVLRIDFPHRLAPVEGSAVCSFITAEFRHVRREDIAGGEGLGKTQQITGTQLITPSEWSREGLLASGADPARVAVVPHGVDISVFRPLTFSERGAARRKLGLRGFLFLHLSALSGSKNVWGLLKALAAVSLKHPDVRLMIKGLDELYGSDVNLRGLMNHLTPEEQRLAGPRLMYVGRELPVEEIARLYQAADAYVAPYRGEGFNLPVLEAVASGLPVIVTRGGPTDAFTNDTVARYVATEREPFQAEDGQEGVALAVSVESLTEQMLAAIADKEAGARVREAGPALVREGFLWDQVTDKLVEVMRSAAEGRSRGL